MPNNCPGCGRRIHHGGERVGQVSLSAQASGKVDFNNLLNIVLTQYHAVDPNGLPGPVKDAWLVTVKAAQDATNKAAAFLGGDDIAGAGSVLGAAGPAMLSFASSVFNGNAQAALQALEVSTVAVITAVNPGLGAATGVTFMLANELESKFGATGGGPDCPQCWKSGFWYGRFMTTETPPPGPGDSRWTDWHNKTHRPESVIGGCVCADDTPTLPNSTKVFMPDMTHAWFGVSGRFDWLETIIANHTSGFDVALANVLGGIIEQYINAHGPMPTSTVLDVGGPQMAQALGAALPTIDLYDAAYRFVAGWNATHLGAGEPGGSSIQVGAQGAISFGLPPVPAFGAGLRALPQKQISSSAFGTPGSPNYQPASTSYIDDWDTAYKTIPAVTLLRLMPRDATVTLNTGPVNPKLAAVFTSVGLPSAHVIHLKRPPLKLKPGALAKSAFIMTTSPLGAAAVAAKPAAPSLVWPAVTTLGGIGLAVWLVNPLFALAGLGLGIGIHAWQTKKK